MRVPSIDRIAIPLSTNWKIFRAAVLIASLSLVVKLASTTKELVVAQGFGRGDALEAFLIAFLLPSFVVNLVAGSFNAALIPTFIQVRETEGREAGQRLFSSVMVCSVGLLVGVSILLAALAPYYLPLLGSGFGAAKLLLTRRLVYVLLPFVVFSGLVVNWTAVLNAGESFALPAFSPILTPFAVVLFVLLGSRVWGILSLALGTVIGAGMEGALLAWAVNSQGTRLQFRWKGMDPHMRQVARQYAPMAAGAFLMSSTNLVDQAMAAMLAPGSVAALNYGNKVINLITALGSSALGTAVLPYFSQMVARQDWEGCRHTLRTYFRLIGLAAVPITAGLVIFSRPLVRVLFERGAFTAGDTEVVGTVQAMYAIQIPFYAWGILLVRLISSLERNDVLMRIASINLALDIVLNLVFMKFLGVAGIALSTSVFYIVSFIYLGLSSHKLIGGEH